MSVYFLLLLLFCICVANKLGLHTIARTALWCRPTWS